MSWKKTLPKLTGLSIVGAAAGLWLGGAAVGEINPFFFSERQTSFVSDRLAYQSPDWAEVQIGEYQQDGLLDGIGRGPMPDAVYASPAVASYGESWSAASAEQAEPVPAWSARDRYAQSQQPVRVWAAEPSPAERAEPDEGRRRVERYANYPISQAEAEQQADAADAEAEAYAAVQEVGSE